ncbi:PspA/IM30 family protein [Bacillus sp. FJAT-45037]|uniref:PspA/IM30 family protein n=1 Tax=Bacillus sp. FJAT-45037 TaxID=2011007 RepID=UPI000C24430D|nr:PspA/IM30 family protein [Bacillus sp. FJAT-45037]
MVLKRIERFVKASIHEGLDRMENPEVMLKQHIRDVKGKIKDTEQILSKQKLIRIRLEEEKEAIERLIEKRDRQAAESLEVGEETLAKKLLLDKKQMQHQVERMDQLAEKSKEVTVYCQDELDELEEQLNELREKKAELTLRMQATRTTEMMNDTSFKASKKLDLHEEFDRLDDQVQRREDRSYAKPTYASKNAMNQYELEVAEELRQLKLKQAEVAK